jgi:hypothetical protein
VAHTVPSNLSVFAIVPVVIFILMFLFLDLALSSIKCVVRAMREPCMLTLHGVLHHRIVAEKLILGHRQILKLNVHVPLFFAGVLYLLINFTNFLDHSAHADLDLV